jgi:hypothetical protein
MRYELSVSYGLLGSVYRPFKCRLQTQVYMCYWIHLVRIWAWLPFTRLYILFHPRPVFYLHPTADYQQREMTPARAQLFLFSSRFELFLGRKKGLAFCDMSEPLRKDWHILIRNLLP